MMTAFRPPSWHAMLDYMNLSFRHLAPVLPKGCPGQPTNHLRARDILKVFPKARVSRRTIIASELSCREPKSPR
jgi:hypothetical protein